MVKQKGQSTTRFDKTIRINIEVNEVQHNAMKELARRRRVQIASEYEQALSQYLDRTENYINKTTQQVINRKVG